MKEVFSSFAKALRDMARGEVLWHAIWPPVLALAAWIAVAFSAGDDRVSDGRADVLVECDFSYGVYGSIEDEA